MATEKQIAKARKSFDYQCKRASKCRHECYEISCNNCPTEKHCDIQIRIKKLLAILRSE